MSHDPNAPLTEGHYDAAVSQVQTALAPRMMASRGAGAEPAAVVSEDAVRSFLKDGVEHFQAHAPQIVGAGQPGGTFNMPALLQVLVELAIKFGPLFFKDKPNAPIRPTR